MPASPELGPTFSRYNQQRMMATHEANRPEAGLIGKILTAIVTKDHYDQTENHYQESNHLWATTREQLIDADPNARAAKKRQRRINARIQELERPPGLKPTSEISDLRAELEEAQKPYTRASRQTSTDPQLQWLAANREQSRQAMEGAKQNLDQARLEALAGINQQLPVNLTWGEVEELLGNKIKRELEITELRLLAAIIDRQEAVASANEVLETELKRIRGGLAAASQIRNRKDGQG